MMLDDLELELRKLPGVRATGFDDRDDVLMIQLHVAADPGRELDVPLPIAASRIATRHSDRPVAVEVVRWRETVTATPATVTPIGPASGGAGPIGQAEPAPVAEPRAEVAVIERPRLLAVLSFPDTDELEVHLVLGGRRTIGRAPASRGLLGAVDATIEAVRALVGLEAVAKWSRALEETDDDAVLVAASIDIDCGEDGTVHLFGLAGGSSPIDAAARATLDALNRRLTKLRA